MTKVLLLLGILFTLSFSASAAGITPDQKKRWREALGSQDYGVRVKAMSEIWETGEEALSLLEELSETELVGAGSLEAITEMLTVVNAVSSHLSRSHT